MQIASVAQTSIKPVNLKDLMDIHILQAVRTLEKEKTSSQLWNKVVEKTGSYIPRALFLSQLENLVAIGILQYTKRETKNGFIREYRMT